MGKGFDEYASAYDAWFLENRNVLYSEVNLVASTLRDAGRILSVGCGSGLFEKILREEYDIRITDGIEPSTGMADIARKRGLEVTVATAEEADFGRERYDTLLFNGTPSYIGDLAGVVRKAYDALPEGGRIVLIDVPKESSYGIMYNLAKRSGRGTIRCSRGSTRPTPTPSSSSRWPPGARRPRRWSCSKRPVSATCTSRRRSPPTRSIRTVPRSSPSRGATGATTWPSWPTSDEHRGQGHETLE